MYSQRTIDKLNAVAYQYRPMFVQAIRAALHKNTGEGAASVAVDVVEGNSTRSPNIVITVNDHVILLDKRKLQWTKLPDVKQLMKWAETKTPSEKEAKRLAWATAWDKRKNDTWKVKPWRKKSLGKVLRELNQMLLQAFDAAINEDLQEAIKRAK